MSMVDEVAYLWVAAKFLSAIGADPCRTHDLAATGSTGKGSRPIDPADAKGTDNHECAIGQRDHRCQRDHGNEHHSQDSTGRARPAAIGEVTRLADCSQRGGDGAQPGGALARRRFVRTASSGRGLRFLSATDSRLRYAVGEVLDHLAGSNGAPGGRSNRREGLTGKAQEAAQIPAQKPTRFRLSAELQRTMGVNLTTVDGIDVMTTQVLLSELGPDLSASFPTADYFASLLELVPRRDISGGKVIRQKSRHSKNPVANALRMAAQSLSRSQSYLGARYRHLRGRLGGQKAVKAMARYLACVVYRLLTKGQAYVDRGAAHYESKRQDREVNALKRRATALGLQLVPAV